MGRRTVLLIAAIIVAALGTTLVFLYVNGINSRAMADQQPTKVLVAKQLIPAGMSGSAAAAAGSFELKTFPKVAVAPGALSDVKPINDMVAQAPIYPGEEIILSQFGNRSATQAIPLPAGTVAISVQLSDPARVAGFVSPGSHVVIFATVSATAPVPGSTPAPAASAAANGGNLTAVLLPDVEVVATGATTVIPVTQTNANGQQQTQQIPQTILTLALTPQQAQKVIWASQQGQLYFGLVNDKSNVKKGPATTLENLFQ